MRWQRVLLPLLAATVALALVAAEVLGAGWAGAPGSAGAAAASRTTLAGWFTILWGDPPPGSGRVVAPVYLLTDAAGGRHRLQLDEALAAPLGGVLRLNRQRVTVTVVRAPRAQAPEGEAELRVLAIEREAGRSAAGLAQAEPIGSRPWASLLCKFADIAAEPRSPAYFRGLLGTARPGVDHYWRESSYNSGNFAGSALPTRWYTLPRSRSAYLVGGLLDFGRLTDDCLAASDAEVHFPDYAGINLMFNAELDGAAWGGTQFLTLDGVGKLYSLTWMPPWGYSHQAVLVHEMGHGLGLPHSSGSYGQIYDNAWDLMSWPMLCNPPDRIYGCVGQHTIAYHKELLGAIPATRQQVVPPGSAQTILLVPLAFPPSGGYLVAEVPIGGSPTRFYTVEARQRRGYDAQLRGEAVIIHEVDVARREPAHVVDADGNGDPDDAGAMWTAGETFIDAGSGISVSVDTALASGFVVTIRNRAPAPSPTARRTPVPMRTATATRSRVTRTPTPPRPTIPPRVTSTPSPTRRAPATAVTTRTVVARR